MSKREGKYEHGHTVVTLRRSGRRVKLLRNIRSGAGALLVGAGTLGYAETAEGMTFVAFDGQAVVREVADALLTSVEGKGRVEPRKAARGQA